MTETTVVQDSACKKISEPGTYWKQNRRANRVNLAICLARTVTAAVECAVALCLSAAHPQDRAAHHQPLETHIARVQWHGTWCLVREQLVPLPLAFHNLQGVGKWSLLFQITQNTAHRKFHIGQQIFLMEFVPLSSINQQWIYISVEEYNFIKLNNAKCFGLIDIFRHGCREF